MVVFKQKDFGAKTKRAAKFVKENAAIPLSVAGLGVSTANLSINSRRQKEAKELAHKQLEIMGKQMDAISANTKAINDSIKSSKEVSSAFREGIKHQPVEEIKTPERKRFFKKMFSLRSNVIAGAQIGFGVTTAGVPFLPKKLNIKKAKDNETVVKFAKGYNKSSEFGKRVAFVAAGTIVGAALGALVGGISELDKRNSRRDVNKRLLPDIISNLKKENFKEGKDFTRDPKMADKLKTRVCMAISRNSGDLRILINTNAEPKLKGITDRVVKNIPNSSVVNSSASNKFNDITISTISDNSADAGLVSGIVSQFIHSGYPVYLVEVG